MVATAPSRAGRMAEVLEVKPPGVPLVSINREVSHPEVHSILVAHRAARRVTEPLLGRGYPTVVFLDIPTTHPLQSSRDMLAGCHDAMQAAALPPLGTIVAPVETLMLCDAYSNGSLGYEAVYSKYYTGDLWSHGQTNDAVHNDGLNVAFCDGHVKWPTASIAQPNRTHGGAVAPWGAP